MSSDIDSLANRIRGVFVYNADLGDEYAVEVLASKPTDFELIVLAAAIGFRCLRDDFNDAVRGGE